MEKISLLLFVLIGLTLSSVARADFSDMMGSQYGYGMMGNSGFWGMGVVGLIYFALASFIFSVIFWQVNKWINKK